MTTEILNTQVVAVSDTAIHIITAGMQGAPGATPFSSTNGMLAQTVASTYTGRAITGTANQIIVTDGDGVAGDPTLSLPQSIHTMATPQFAKMLITGGTLGGASTGDNFLNITGTLASVNTAGASGVRMEITGAGTSNQLQNAFTIQLLAGYTGASQTRALNTQNLSAGTGATYAGSSAGNGYRVNNGNFSNTNLTQGATSGINVGSTNVAGQSSTANYGAWNAATATGNSPALSVGTASFALNATTSCAGYFGLQDNGTSAPTFANAALIADNGATTSDIFVARDNGSVIFTIKDGGVISHAAARIDRIRTVTAAGAVNISATTDHVIEINKSSGAATTVNLPASPSTGLTFIIKDGKFDAATNNITLIPASGNINNAATHVISTNGGCARVIYNGTQWLVI